jgi:hypothetical protein
VTVGNAECGVRNADSAATGADVNGILWITCERKDLVHLPHKVAGVQRGLSEVRLAGNLLHLPRKGAGVVARLVLRHGGAARVKM